MQTGDLTPGSSLDVTDDGFDEPSHCAAVDVVAWPTSRSMLAR